MNRRLLLFDIDQTLIDTAGVGMRCLSRALHEVAGISVEGMGIVPDGKTDPSILAEMLTGAGHSLDGRESEVWLLYARYLGEALARGGSRHETKPGVPRLLEALAVDERACLGLLTGNLEPTARIKLGAFGLDRYFSVGAYGSDHSDRRALGPVALARAREHFDVPFAPEHVWVIGDTPRDVDAAHAFGARALAVATGRIPLDALSATGAAGVLPDLSDTEAVLRLLLS